MEKKYKELLLKDLCVRLPYHPRVKVWLKDGTTEECTLDLEHNYGDVLRDTFYYNKIVKIKSYLRPMSSMTEEEKLMYEGLMIGTDNISYMLDVVDWLNAHHFDYRGLIDKSLALDATGLNIY